MTPNLFANVELGREIPSYKPLTSSLCKLRNVLGDIDEALDDSHDPTISSDSKLQSNLSSSRSILEKLDVALVTYRCMTQPDIDTSAVASLKTTVEEITQELATAYEKLTRTGEISMSACSCVLVRKASNGSKGSSSWSIVNRDVPDEKEVCKPSCARLQPSASSTSLGSNGKTPSWRSISLDPLSKPIGDASKMILSSNSPVEAPAEVLMPGALAETTMFAEQDSGGQASEEVAAHHDDSRLRKDSIMASASLS